MIITKIDTKYNINGNQKKGITSELKNAPEVLNKIIDIGNSFYQEDIKEENKPITLGDCFLIDGQIVAVDKDELILITSDTGYKGLERIIEETIKPELDLKETDLESDTYDITWKDIENIEEDLDIYVPDFSYYKIWRKMYPEKKLVEINITDNFLGLTRTLIFGDFKVFSTDLDLVEVKYFTHLVLSWFYNGRL